MVLFFNKLFCCVMLSSFLIKRSFSMFITLSPNKKECLYQAVHPDNNFVGKYSFVGENEERNRVMVFDGKNNIIWQHSDTRDSEFSINVNHEQDYKICFENLDKKTSVLTFDFHEESAKNNVVSVQNISDMNKNVHEIRKRVDIIHSDLRNSVVRRNQHLDSKYFFLF